MAVFYKPTKDVGYDFSGDKLTKESHAAECDINTILNQYSRTGVLNHMAMGSPEYLDVSDVDFQEAMNTVLSAQSAFAALPARIRDRYRNDPAAFLAAFADQDERKFLQDEGIIQKPVQEPPAASDASSAT